MANGHTGKTAQIKRFKISFERINNCWSKIIIICCLGGLSKMIIVYTLNCLGLTNLRINFRNCNRRFDFSADSLLQLCSWHCLFYTSNNMKYLLIHRKYLEKIFEKSFSQYRWHIYNVHRVLSIAGIYFAKHIANHLNKCVIAEQHTFDMYKLLIILPVFAPFYTFGVGNLLSGNF